MEAGHEVVIFDNLYNSEYSVVSRIGVIVGHEPNFVKGDIRVAKQLDSVLSSNSFDAVIHFAGLKAVGESVVDPLRYWEWNVSGTQVLLNSMASHGVKRFIFSSSATVDGAPEQIPIPETAKINPTNPYGRTKAAVEDMLEDLAASDPAWRIVRLRYFNPVGAHPSGLIGEAPQGTPNNLMPYIAQVAIGLRKTLSIFGNDYATSDGTGVRDYIHVMDLADGHLAALNALRTPAEVLTINLGTGEAHSVLEMVATFEKVSGQKVPYKIEARRSGDVAICFADVTLAKRVLGWSATRGVEEMCADTWRWQRGQPLCR